MSHIIWPFMWWLACRNYRMYIVYDCILVICLPEILLYIHRMSMVLANPRRGSWKVMERSWKGHGKVMERSWKGHGKVMEGHGKVMEGHGRSWKVMEGHGRSWKGHGKVMERSWKGHGKVMEGHGRSWKVMEGHGRSWKVMERSWKGHGKVVATMALRRLILSIWPCYPFISSQYGGGIWLFVSWEVALRQGRK